jgi:hypothetical protein
VLQFRRSYDVPGHLPLRAGASFLAARAPLVDVVPDPALWLPERML